MLRANIEVVHDGINKLYVVTISTPIMGEANNHEDHIVEPYGADDGYNSQSRLSALVKAKAAAEGARAMFKALNKGSLGYTRLHMSEHTLARAEL